MNIKYLVGAVIEVIIKVIVIAVGVMFVFRASTAAYDFGYKVFADKPDSVSGGRTITVGIAESASVKDIAEMLQEKGLTISGTSPDDYIVETVELSGCRFYIGVQYHPEFKSRPNKPHPLFLGLIQAAMDKAKEET